ncbi:MAG: starch-binding protein, partial [Lachnospiraceae bacterium]|nr:starch-binding protein [Lachnospiraceae bacterium]
MKLNKRLRKVFSMFLAFLMFCSVVCADLTLIAPKTVVEAATTEYGLLDNACDGLILHCWNWSYTNIKNSMADIAAAGYTSLQTSPVQMPKDAGSDTQMNWWKVYQPTTLSMVDSHPWFGTKAEFKAMCDEAEKYGIKVIVDIVANHMANNTGSKGNCTDDICSQNDPTFRDDSSCWHLNGSTYIDYGNQHRNGDTTSLTWGFGGWPDLNTGSTKVQNAIISLLKECVDLGADGFRFDAAKHIELPTDPGGASDFWPNVTNAIRAYKSDVYLYGEILDDSATSISNYTKYIAVTDNRAGNSTRYGVRDNNIGKAANSSLTYDGELGDNIVLWAESHDTYANDNFTGESASFSQAQINRAWCITAARDFAALYYVRPGSTSAAMGTKSTNTAWKDTEIVAVNKFHNYFNGTSEYMSSYDNSVVLVERGSKTADGGVVLVNIGGGSKSVSGATTHLLADGTYTDQVSGSTFTVSGGKISGQIGSTGVAVVYNPGTIVVDPVPTISTAGGNFSTDTLTLTIGLKNATSGTYQIGSGSATTYTSSKSITIGSDMAVGDSVTITLTATDGTSTTTKTYTFKKVEKAENIVYYQNTGNWSSVYAYYWSTSDTTMSTWPGVQMTSEGNGVYSIEVPENATSIIFNDGSSNKTDDLTIQMGKLYKNGSWTDYDPDYEFTPPYENGIYFENTAGWSSVKAYYWSDSNISMSTWPGVAMTEVESGIYGLELDSSFAGTYVIFNDGGSNKTDDLTFTMNGYYNTSGLVKVLDTAKKGTVTVKYVDESGNEIAKSKTMTGTVG